ncbi:MAG TPA: glycosyltransferase family 4 protein, partial [Myxococcales bacterium]|nr:glycosyltransferase family 4 protein [Myxococcales bacterium]
MSGPVLLVSGDFVQTGGMDVANYALARYLLDQGREVHLVAHRVAPELAAHPGARAHRVPRPGRSYFAGAPLLDVAGRRWGRRTLARMGRVVVNGGNCAVADVNWVHYVHAAFRPEGRFSAWRRLKVLASDAFYRAQEARRISSARVVVANSERTRTDVIERLGVRPERVQVVYYGTDPERF